MAETAQAGAIRVGDKFKSATETYEVTEAMPFGRGYWVITEDRCRQTIFKRHTLESMQRVALAEGRP